MNASRPRHGLHLLQSQEVRADFPIASAQTYLNAASIHPMSVHCAKALEQHFRVGPLDVEWLTIGDKIYVVQARPFDIKPAR